MLTLLVGSRDVDRTIVSHSYSRAVILHTKVQEITNIYPFVQKSGVIAILKLGERYHLTVLQANGY